MLSNDILIYDKINRKWIKDPSSWVLGELKMSGFVTCHYTGLHDIEGKKIYEYNIVQTYYHNGDIRSTFYIKYINGLCKFNVDTNLVQSRNLKVIGNVFDDIYLLPEKYRDKLEQELGFKLYERKMQKGGN